MVKIRVSNIAASVSKYALQRLFEEFGEVSSVKIFRTSEGHAIGFVEMDKEVEGHEAVAMLNGEELGGQMISAEISSDKIISQKPKLGSRSSLDMDEDEEDEQDASMVSSAEKQSEFVDPEAEEAADMGQAKWERLRKESKPSHED